MRVAGSVSRSKGRSKLGGRKKTCLREAVECRWSPGLRMGWGEVVIAPPCAERRDHSFIRMGFSNGCQMSRGDGASTPI